MPEVIPHPSPNHGERRGDARPEIVVLHYTAMASAGEALERLCDPETEVSAHYLVCREGRVFQLVEESRRAWHAGAGCWGEISDLNSHSIGIELDNDGVSPFTEPQMAALEGLLADILARHGIAPYRVIGHSDMAPERKIDPGAKFDWRRLAMSGLSVWPEGASGSPSKTFPDAAAEFGYATSGPEAVLSAFRSRFRPGASGPVCQADADLATELARQWPLKRD